jgi:magnesium-transporting ATPase (P-type)
MVRNSGNLYMIVVFTGKDTKIIMNNGRYKFKKSVNDRTVNFFLVLNVIQILVPLGITLSLLAVRFNKNLADH